MKRTSSKNLENPTTKPKDKWSYLQNILDKGGPQVGETDFSFQVIGVYSPPEFFSKLVSSGSVDTWSFSVKLCDAEIKGGKFNFRELTEEEKKELENKKKPPPKINKKDIAALKAEEERILREQKEKEEKEKEFQEILDKMSPEEQFYYIKEIPTKDSWISWAEGQNIATVKKLGEKFIEFEGDINNEGGTILELQFLPPPDEDPKKRPKPKGITPEEVKPVYAVSWIDFSKFQTTPGLTEIVLRSKLLSKETYEKRIDDLEKKINKKIFNPNNEEYQKMIKENEEENKDYIEKSNTYVYIRIAMSQPVNPVLPNCELPTPLDLIKNPPKKKKPMTVEEIENDLLRQFKIAIAAIAKTYDESMGDTAKGQLVKREKGNVLSNVKKDEKENNFMKFLDKFNTSGRADLLKEKLKKFIVRIVREKYGKKNTPVKGVHKDKRDQFYSELYAYLTDAVKQATNEFVKLKKDELHEHVIVSFSQSKKEIMNYAIRQNKEPEDKRLLRLSKENELLNDYEKALKYFNSRLLLDPNKEAWLAYGNLAKKMGDLPEVEKALTNAITLDSDNADLNMQIVFCGLLYLKGQIANAINYLVLFLMKYGLKNTTYLFNAFLSFLYKEKSNSSGVNNNKNNKISGIDALAKKHWEASKLMKLKSLPPDEIVTPRIPEDEEDEEEKKKKKKEKNEEENLENTSNKNYGNPRLHPDFIPPQLTNEQMDSIWFESAFLFNRFNFHEISEKLLKNVTEETKQKTQYKSEQAKILLYKKDYEKAIDYADEIIKENQLSYDAYLAKGHALFFLNRYKEAEDTYIKAIRFKPQEKKFDLEMLVKLGIIYINNKQWYDAKVVFKQVLRDSVEHSFGWRYLGFALTKLGEFDEAEKALRRANLLDVENPVIWAYLAIYSLSTGKKYQALECLNELSKVNFSDKGLLKEIGNLFLGINEYEVAANIFISIKSKDKTDGDSYLKIAKIYCEKLNKRKEALNVLKEGYENVVDEKQKQEIEYLISKISQDEEDLFTGVINTEDLFNEMEINAKKFNKEDEKQKDVDSDIGDISSDSKNSEEENVKKNVNENNSIAQNVEDENENK